MLEQVYLTFKICVHFFDSMVECNGLCTCKMCVRVVLCLCACAYVCAACTGGFVSVWSHLLDVRGAHTNLFIYLFRSFFSKLLFLLFTVDRFIVHNFNLLLNHLSIIGHFSSILQTCTHSFRQELHVTAVINRPQHRPAFDKNKISKIPPDLTFHASSHYKFH